jgi:hypothetical protein
MKQNDTRTAGSYTMTLTLEANVWHMRGGKYGDHSVPNEGDDRVSAHWDGYCEASGWRKPAPARINDGETIFNAMTGSSASWKKHFAGRY